MAGFLNTSELTPFITSGKFSTIIPFRICLCSLLCLNPLFSFPCLGNSFSSIFQFTYFLFSYLQFHCWSNPIICFFISLSSIWLFCKYHCLLRFVYFSGLNTAKTPGLKTPGLCHWHSQAVHFDAGSHVLGCDWENALGLAESSPRVSSILDWFKPCHPPKFAFHLWKDLILMSTSCSEVSAYQTHHLEGPWKEDGRPPYVTEKLLPSSLLGFLSALFWPLTVPHFLGAHRYINQHLTQFHPAKF